MENTSNHLTVLLQATLTPPNIPPVNCSLPSQDISLQQARMLLDFMYRGKVEVREEELQGLLRVAECLQLKGLVGPVQHGESPPPLSDVRVLILKVCLPCKPGAPGGVRRLT